MVPLPTIHTSSRATNGLLPLVSATCKVDTVPENTLSQHSVISWGYHLHITQITWFHLSNSKLTDFIICNSEETVDSEES